MPRFVVTQFSISLFFILSFSLGAADPSSPRKVAFLVGVNKYQKPAFSNLTYAEQDVQEVGAELKRQGFEVTILTGSGEGAKQATRVNVLATIRQLVAPLSKSDVMLVMLSGHGQQFDVRHPDGMTKNDAFYCPVDGVNNDPETLVSISYLIDEILAPNVGRKLVLIDACRDQPKDSTRGSSKGVQGRVIALPEDTAVLFSCKAGQQSYEFEELGHGVFTHCVLDGLRGAAAQQSEVSWTSLVAHVSREMSQPDLRKLLPQGRQQTPIPAGGVEYTVLATITTPKTPDKSKMDKPPTPLSAPFTAEEARTSQAAWAKHLKLDVEIENSIGMKLTLIPPGEFQMGSHESAEETAAFAVGTGYKDAKAENYNDEHPRHRVKLTKPFYLGTHEVTKREFRKFVTDEGYRTEAETDGKGGWGFDGEEFKQDPKFTWKNVGFDQTDDHPVVNVTWNDTEKYLGWLSDKEGVTYRLPTEAEWEYACRAGTMGRYVTGNDPEELAEVGNVADGTARKKFSNLTTISAEDGYVFTAPVGSFRKNPFGLRDMHGNVWEWCSDWYDEKYYANSPQENPEGASSGSLRVLRGGSWGLDPAHCRLALRYGNAPSDRGCSLGFRLARVP
ncbi:MAG: SUMF1/EgtB/PvdO family nonheme iron enzyme [Planctomycetaceae bacterium]|nr:SUMF1/EgtB/PvdO family nonheme iron enzyme [Planctomycetaceae bacterium]